MGIGTAGGKGRRGLIKGCREGGKRGMGHYGKGEDTGTRTGERRELPENITEMGTR